MAHGPTGAGSVRRVRRHDRPQVRRCRCRAHRCRFHHDFLARLQGDCPREGGRRPARVAPGNERVTMRSGDRHRRHLQIQRVVFRHDHHLRRVVGHVDQFCSRWVSNSSTARSLPDWTRRSDEGG